MPSPPTAPVALEKAYGLALWLIGKTGAMPRAHRFTLGDRIYSQSLDLVTTLTHATFSRDKSRALETASDRVNSLRILLRLAKDINLVPFDPYTFLHPPIMRPISSRMARKWIRTLPPISSAGLWQQTVWPVPCPPASRNPRFSFCSSGWLLLRYDERAFLRLLMKEPPRHT